MDSKSVKEKKQAAQAAEPVRDPWQETLDRVAKGEEGVAESPLPARFLPAPAPAALREDIAELRRITGMRKRAGWLG